MWISCHRIGRPPISTSGLGSDEPRSCRRVPRPPPRITTVGRSACTAKSFSRSVPWVASAAVSAVANPDIFKAYDIRGLYGTDIDAGTAQLIGRAFARVIAELEGKPTTA